MEKDLNNGDKKFLYQVALYMTSNGLTLTTENILTAMNAVQEANWKLFDKLFGSPEVLKTVSDSMSASVYNQITSK